MKNSLQNILGFSRTQRMGVLSLAALILIVQIVFWASLSRGANEVPPDKEWLAMQTQIDSMRAIKKAAPVLYPFNPNFITDYKGYRLGMSVVEIDRLLRFRKENLYVNSAAEFQKVTGVSDSLLAAISPYFKFPDWVRSKGARPPSSSQWKTRPATIVKADVNSANKEQFMAVYGIGNALSDRILAQREILGGFVDMSQMKSVWGLSDEVIQKLVERFEVRQIPKLNKVAVNEASVRELAAFPYFNYKLAKAIVTYRSMKGKILSADDLLGIDEFPVDNVKIISLYLEF